MRRTLLCQPLGNGLAQLALENLADGANGQLAEQLQPLGQLERSDLPFAQKGD